jgi:hypothetical protein
LAADYCTTHLVLYPTARKNISDIMIEIPSKDTPRIQECHILIGHIICQQVEEILFK